MCAFWSCVWWLCRLCVPFGLAWEHDDVNIPYPFGLAQVALEKGLSSLVNTTIIQLSAPTDSF